MIRLLHRWPGLIAMALVTLLALSGAVLSVFPVAERLSAPQAEATLTVGTLATRIQQVYPGVEQIRRSPSGQIKAYWFEDGAPGAAVIDPATGQGIASADPNGFERWVTNLHRSLFLDDSGRMVMAAGAAAMLVLTMSGTALVARRVGGWKRWFTPLRGPLSGRLHVEVARIAVVGLALSSATALWMSAATFELIPEVDTSPAFPAQVSGEMGVALSDMAVLETTPVAELRSLSFPYAGDASDVYTLSTDTGRGYLDQGTGAVLAWQDLSGWAKVSETIYMLHTGQGAATLGVVLGLMALSVPLMGVTGAFIWLSRARGHTRIKHNHPASKAQTIVLVGSEGGSTWGFAATLHKALTDLGQTVHAGPLSSFEPNRYAHAERILILAATYGDGDAPSSAKGMLERMAQMTTAPNAPLAVLGFGERSYPAYCAFAKQIVARAQALGWAELVPFNSVDRQSTQDFAGWGRDLGAALGVDLSLNHQPVLPATQALTLLAREDFGAEVQSPTAILRFALPTASVWQRITGRGFAKFQSGDLLGIVPEGDVIPRLYSLASGRRDGFVEIVVKKHPGGLCSGQLIELKVGDAVQGFVRPNPSFHMGRGKAAVILIGAGTGVGPLAGHIRANANQRPLHLFFGMRHKDSDFLYGAQIGTWQQDGRLAELVTAVSRSAKPHYVQDALRAEGANIAALIRDGARVMVCGGRGMAGGVSQALEEILSPLGLSPLTLKAEGRYVEDVY